MAGMDKHPALGVNIANSASQAGADCALAASLGASWVRVSIEQSNGHAIADLTAIAKAAHDHGLKLFQTCQPIGHVQPRTQLAIDTYATHVAAASTIADATGRDNESNGYGSNETPDPVACAVSMLACIEARDAAAHGRDGRILVTDELEPASGAVGERTVAPITFLSAYLKAEPAIARVRKVWIGWHGYGGFGHPAGEVADWNTCYRARDAQALLRNVYGVNPTLASTEFGSPTGPPGFAQARTPAQQAGDVDSYRAEWLSQRKARAVRHGPWIWYCLRDRTPSDSKDWPAAAGLVDVHGNPKPAAARFTAWARA